MCLIFIYTDPSPPKNGYRVVAVSNRDEFYSRPAKRAFHCKENNLVGGQDLEKGREGGMWFGISLKQTDAFQFRLGCVLNLLGDDLQTDLEGRGAVVPNFLKTDLTTDEYLETLKEHQYNAYNFITIELKRDCVITSHHTNKPFSCEKFEGKQVLGFGNSTTSVPLQKVVNGRAKFKEIIRSCGDVTKDELIKQLTQLLKHQEKYLPDPELARRTPWFNDLASIYVRKLDVEYGTRTHSILLIDYDWNVDFVELAMEEPIDANQPTWKTFNFNARL